MRRKLLLLSALVVGLATSCVARGELSVAVDTSASQPAFDVVGADVITSLSVFRCDDDLCRPSEESGEVTPCDAACDGETRCEPPAEIERCMWFRSAIDFTGDALHPALAVPLTYPSDAVESRSLDGSRFTADALANELGTALVLTPGRYLVRATRSGGGGPYAFFDVGTAAFEVP